jgi:hypothetical protein
MKKTKRQRKGKITRRKTQSKSPYYKLCATYKGNYDTHLVSGYQNEIASLFSLVLGQANVIIGSPSHTLVGGNANTIINNITFQSASLVINPVDYHTRLNL